ncbi:MAG: AAA family ATP:ADP antiporter [Bradymonadia bacterium]|jgi:AAA family ATP:ADP antiporter
MFSRLRQIRPDERRDTLVASVTLFALMLAHALLETARDALFLASIPPSRLPLVYLGVAAASLSVAALQERGPGGKKPLAGWLVLSGLVTIGFQPLLTGATWALYALYIWSAVVVTVALSRLFLLLGSRFTASQAKRVYAVIGAGSVVGAISGSAIASQLANVLPTSMLLLVAGGVLIVSAAGPLLLTTTEAADRKAEKRGSLIGHAKDVAGHPYASRVACLLVLATIVFTLVDYVFKSEVALRVAPDELGYFFARLYLGLNILSLIAQLFLVRFVLRVLGTTRAIAVLPALLFVGASGVAAGLGIGAAVAMKGADGALRHSLHRTASELLFVPMSDRMRNASKTFIDLAGHRTAQAIASVSILAAVALGAESRFFGVAIVLLAAGCVALAIELRPHYLGVFRDTLSEAAEFRPVAFPDLTLANLESLLAALNDREPARVKIALQLFGEQDRAHLIPGLILYHPSPEVLAPALDLLASTGRTDFMPLVRPLLNHEYADVRAAALRAHMAIEPNEELLRERIEISCPVVRATALVGLTKAGYADVDETSVYLQKVIDEGSDVAKEALARAIGYGPIGDFAAYLIALADSPSDEVVVSVVRSMAEAPTAEFVPSLIRLLTRREVRTEVRRTLRVLGEPAFDALVQTLEDESAHVRLRQQVPHALLGFDPQRVVDVLQAHLTSVQAGRVRYKLLRALGRHTAANPGLTIDRGAVEDALSAELSRAFAFIDWRLILERGATEIPARKTAAFGLLCRMLADKEIHAIERVFRLLGILSPGQDVHTIFRGLNMRDGDVRASSRELLDSFVRPKFRAPVLGIVDEVPDGQRLELAGAHYRPSGLAYEPLLRRMLAGGSESIRSLAVYHVGELGISEFAQAVEAIEAGEDTALGTLVRQSLEWLNVQNPEVAT